MDSKFYLSRILRTTDNQEFNESELLSIKNKVIIVLAEPGAGKSYLLDSLAKQIGVTKHTANIFIHSNKEKCSSLVIDGFDELVKIDSSTVIKALVMAKNTSAERIILSSRSSEWSESYTTYCMDIFNEEPLLVYLKPFDDQEQQEIFNSYYPEEDAKQFLKDAGKIELTPLLSNPLFLKLFSKSYIDNNHQFESRYSAFKFAIEGLAKESNPKHISLLPATRKIELAEDIFTKLMLSGSEGVSLSDSASNRFYPHIATLNSDVNIKQILSTQFFLPTDGTEQHRPVHRIVAEYCAGSYLAKKLTSEVNPLSLRRILSIIAPNNIVRDELRGLFAWMTVLSENQRIQDRLIDLDPYAILSNGDPALLLPTSKIKLLSKLKELNQKYPYFRRSDKWRGFSFSGFFTDELVDELKNLLSSDNSDGDLQGLLLELLTDSPIVSKLTDELKSIACNTSFKDKYMRRLAGKYLSTIKNYNYQDIWKDLINAGDNTSLTIAADMMTSSDDEFQVNDYVNFLRVCAELYPTDHRIERSIGGRFFIKQFIQRLHLDLVISLLNELSANLFCSCQKKHSCQCRIGISKIISMLLDPYFELSQEPWEPEQIWIWVKNLYFQRGVRKEDSLSVKILSENDDLRQSIIKTAFKNKFDHKVIHETKMYGFEWYTHSGLKFQSQDLKYIIDLAFDTDNIELWSCFMARHNFHSKEKVYNSLRQYMRMQALKKPEFLRVWYKSNREHKKHYRNYRNSILRYNRKKSYREYNKKQRKRLNKDIQYIQENRKLIESGKHWNALLHFSHAVLFEPNKIIENFGDEELIRNSLYNCLDYIKPDIPSLLKLAELHSQSQHLNIELVLYAACLEILKRDGSLNSVSVDALIALRAGFSTYWLGMDSSGREMLKQEVDRCLFSCPADAEKFLREYIEPQLTCVESKSIPVDWLTHDETFKFLQETLPLEWLKKFPNMNFSAQKELLQLAIQFGNREGLKELVHQHCKKLVNMELALEDTEIIFKRNFWFAHAFYLLSENYEPFWQELIKDADSIFILEDHFGYFGDYSKWISLSSIKIELILNSFIDQWQEVYLPSMHGSDSPPSEKAYRFLSGLIYKLEGNDEDNPVPVIDRLLQDVRYTKFYTSLKSIRFNYLRKSAIQNFQAPTAEQIVHLLDRDEIISVENLRAVILEELQAYQNDLNGCDTPTKSIFYHGEMNIANRVDENTATQRIAEHLRLRLENRQVIPIREGYMKDDNRCDIVFSKLIDGRRKILPVEVKGQWHPKLYSAFDSQLNRLYTIHPDAEGQGIYLVLWFGSGEKVANRKKHGINSAEELYLNIQKQIPEELKRRIDIFVLDLAR